MFNVRYTTSFKKSECMIHYWLMPDVRSWFQNRIHIIADMIWLDQRWVLHKGNFRDNKKLGCEWPLAFLCHTLSLFTGDQVNETHYSWSTHLICWSHYLQEEAFIAFMAWGVSYWSILTHQRELCFSWRQSQSSYWQHRLASSMKHK